MNKKKTSVYYGFILVIGVLALTWLDQWTKALAVEHLKDNASIVLLPGIFELQYLENTGAAFGILNNQLWFFYIVTIVMSSVIIWVYFKLPKTRYYLPVHMILIFLVAGALGNFIDRVSNHYVIDFFYFSLINFPIFNVADIYVTVGVALLCVLILFIYKEEDFEFLFQKKMK